MSRQSLSAARDDDRAGRTRPTRFVESHLLAPLLLARPAAAHAVAVACVAACAAIFLLDLVTPGVVSPEVLYGIVLLGSLWTGRPTISLALAGLMYHAFLSERLDQFVYGYVTMGYQSTGAWPRVAMKAVANFLTPTAAVARMFATSASRPRWTPAPTTRRRSSLNMSSASVAPSATQSRAAKYAR